MNCTLLNQNNSRIEFDCEIKDQSYIVWIDTGAPNTMVHSDTAKALGLKPVKGASYSGAVAGVKFTGKPAVVIPEIVIEGYHPLKNVSAITGLNDPKWKNIILIGLNVLNHLTYKIDRSQMPGTFEWLETLTPVIPATGKTKFNHLLINGVYMVTDEDIVTISTE